MEGQIAGAANLASNTTPRSQVSLHTICSESRSPGGPRPPLRPLFKSLCLCQLPKKFYLHPPVACFGNDLRAQTPGVMFPSGGPASKPLSLAGNLTTQPSKKKTGPAGCDGQQSFQTCWTNVLEGSDQHGGGHVCPWRITPPMLSVERRFRVFGCFGRYRLVCHLTCTRGAGEARGGDGVHRQPGDVRRVARRVRRHRPCGPRVPLRPPTTQAQ